MLHWPKKSLVMPFYYINFDQNGPPYRCSISGVYYQGPNTHESTLNCPMYCSNYYPIKHRVFPEETKFSKVWSRDLSLRIGADAFFLFFAFFFFCLKFPIAPNGLSAPLKLILVPPLLLA